MKQHHVYYHFHDTWFLEAFTHATADFNQKYIDGVQDYEVNGELLDNGNFIFYWNNDGLWKMVLTTNDGITIQDGHVMEPGYTWKDPSSWSILKPGYYFITNFEGRTESKGSM